MQGPLTVEDGFELVFIDLEVTLALDFQIATVILVADQAGRTPAWAEFSGRPEIRL
jgi:hypothetical protein